MNDTFTFYNNAAGTILNRFEGFEYPSVIASIDDLSGPYGSTYITSKFGSRRFSISGDLVSADVFNLRIELLKAVRQTGVIKLIKFTTYDNRLLQTEAEVVKMVNPYNHSVHTFLIEMIAPDYRFYSQTEKNLPVSTSFLGGGVSIPFPEIPVSIEADVEDPEGGVHFLTNEGNAPTDPVFKIYGPGTDFALHNIATDEVINIDTTLVEGDVLVINVKERTIVLNGTDNLYSAFSGDFFSLIPGENETRFFISSGFVDGTTRMEAIYRDAWDGI